MRGILYPMHKIHSSLAESMEGLRGEKLMCIIEAW